MSKKLLIYFFQLLLSLNLLGLQGSLHAMIKNEQLSSTLENEVVVATKRIPLEGFPKAFNPSIIQTNFGWLLTFRYLPEPKLKPWISHIGVVLLNESLEQISKPELIHTSLEMRKSPSQAEDARIFSYQDKMYLLYNDNIEITSPNNSERRDMFLAEISYDGEHFTVLSPFKLMHEGKYFKQKWQKNWVPFVWNETLLFSYSLAPHEVLAAELQTGCCQSLFMTSSTFPWKYGTLRGGTPAMLVDGEYLAFFHSSMVTRSESSKGKRMHHYYMGAYTFSSQPPFAMTHFTPAPIIEKGFYTVSDYDKRVIFPGGYVILGEFIYLAYGKDDMEVWVAIINKDELKKTMLEIP